MVQNISRQFLGISFMLIVSLADAQERDWTIPAPSSPSHPSGKYQTEIPKDVESMWAFYQKRNIQSPEGCIIGGDALSPSDFKQKINDFVDYAARNNVALIITAYSPSRGWVGAADEIRINGKPLKPTRPYWCNGKRNYGYELELR